tara:strand:+ start:2536 stop:2949 length:414 start_codon:yes stop_codon:yes gene_type:complete
MIIDRVPVPVKAGFLRATPLVLPITTPLPNSIDLRKLVPHRHGFQAPYDNGPDELERVQQRNFFYKITATIHRNHFVDILPGNRFDIARELGVKPELSLSEVASYLGFNDQSAFQHAFLRWEGTTPGCHITVCKLSA